MFEFIAPYAWWEWAMLVGPAAVVILIALVALFARREGEAHPVAVPVLAEHGATIAAVTPEERARYSRGV